MKRLAVSTAIASVLAISTYTAQASGVSLDDFTMTRADLDVMAKEAVVEDDGDMRESLIDDMAMDDEFMMDDDELAMDDDSFGPDDNDLAMSDDDFEMDGENPFDDDSFDMDDEDLGADDSNFAMDDNDFTMNDDEESGMMGSGDMQNGNDTSTSPVPVPAAFWLFGSGLLGLAGMSRKKAS